jgi:hypothetical protein
MSISMPRDLTVWTELNVIHKGCPVRGWYRAHETARGEKTKQIGGSNPTELAYIMLRELADEGKA